MIEFFKKYGFSMKGNKIHFISLGCSRNLVDTEVMLGLVLRAGFEIVNEVEKADYCVINTCAFLEASRNEGLATIQSVFDEKKEKAKVIVVGCMVQKHRELIEERFPHVHAYLGSGDMEKILEAIHSSGDHSNLTGEAKSYLQQGEVPRVVASASRFAYLKIAEGCRKRCSFCIIPTIKGNLRSKSSKNSMHCLMKVSMKSF